MKRLLSLAAMLLVCCVTLFAQQALWGGAAVVSQIGRASCRERV